MKRYTATLLLFGVITLTGCGDQEAREYAAKLIPVLDAYQEEVSQKIKAEQESYDSADRRYVEASKREISIRLAAERDARSEQLEDELAGADKPPTLSEIFAALQDYGDHDFNTTKSILAAAMNTRSDYVAELEGLEIEQQKIKLLKESLTELAKAKSGSKEFKEAAAFLVKTKAELAKNPCGNLQNRILALQADETKDGDKKDADQNSKRLTERLLAKNCN